MFSLLWNALSWTIFLAVLFRFVYWLYFSVISSPSSTDLTRFGSRSRRSWALITGAADGIGLGLAKVRRL